MKNLFLIQSIYSSIVMFLNSWHLIQTSDSSRRKLLSSWCTSLGSNSLWNACTRLSTDSTNNCFPSVSFNNAYNTYKFKCNLMELVRETQIDFVFEIINNLFYAQRDTDRVLTIINIFSEENKKQLVCMFCFQQRKVLVCFEWILTISRYIHALFIFLKLKI